MSNVLRALLAPWYRAHEAHDQEERLACSEKRIMEVNVEAHLTANRAESVAKKFVPRTLLSA